MYSRIYSIEHQHLPKFKAWCHALATDLHSEALETLREEGVTREIAYLISCPEKDESYILMFCDQAAPKPANMKRSINIKHHEMLKLMSTIDNIPESGSMLLLYDLKT
jgi:Family of unknown function (DUF6176)